MNKPAEGLLDSERDVVLCLTTFTDWWQPSSASVVALKRIQRKDRTDGIHPGLIATMETRTELCRRMNQLPQRDREILFLWYVKQQHVDDISETVGVSRRQCFRRRSQAVRRLVGLGQPQESVSDATARDLVGSI